jgi:carboxyl-terminal processing protease
MAEPDVNATTREMADFYATKIEDAITLNVKERPADATPEVSELWDEAISGMVDGLGDQFSAYLPPVQNEDLQKSLSGEPNEEDVFYGVGINVDWDTVSDLGVLVINPLPNSPASEHNIQSGDIIIAVSNTELKDLEGSFREKLEQAVEMIKGKKDSEVELTIKKSSSPEPLVLKLTRQPINPNQLIFKEILDDEEGDIGWLHLYSFYEHAAEDILENMRELKLAGAKKIIFDLRWNPGGYLDQAVDIADIFLKEGDLITYTAGRTVTPEHFYDQSTDEDFSDMPMVILLHKWSASASEVVTGALKDHHRATVIGEKSFGKGSVQQVIPLNGGAALRLTVSKYYTPSGVCIHEMGIDPDIEVERLTEEQVKELDGKDYDHVSRLERLFDGDRQLKAAYEYLRGEHIVESTHNNDELNVDKG